MIRRLAFIVMMAAVCTLSCRCMAVAAETHALKVRISDIDGRHVEAAKLFLYDSPNVRRPADFISSLSDRSGRVQIDLPPGKYWAVARFKNDGKYGPLLPGDKHSGEPLEVDMSSGGVEADFVIADIRELGQKKRANATDALRIRGQVTDTQGAPVAQAVVYANRSREFSELPDLLSAWTGDDGLYELYLPPGAIYYVGVSRQFPLVFSEGPFKPTVVDGGKIDIALDINLTVQ